MEEEEKYPTVNSYHRAFDFVVFNQSGTQLLIDTISVVVGTECLVLLIGQIPWISRLHDWLIDESWWSIPYILVPFLVTIYLVFIKDKDGLSVWSWLFETVRYWLIGRKKFIPMQEKGGR